MIESFLQPNSFQNFLLVPKKFSFFTKKDRWRWIESIWIYYQLIIHHSNTHSVMQKIIWVEKIEEGGREVIEISRQ